MICSEKALGPFAATCIGAVPYASVLSRDLSRLSREAGYLCSIQASRLADLHFLPHTRAHDAIRPRTAFERDVPKSPSDQRAGRWPLLAHRDVPLRVTALVAIGGIADMNGHVSSDKSVEIDPACVKTHTSAKCRK